jgi:hypothetical protein
LAMKRDGETSAETDDNAIATATQAKATTVFHRRLRTDAS